MEENTNKKESKAMDTKMIAIKAVKIGVFAALGYVAAGPLGALIGLILAMAK